MKKIILFLFALISFFGGYAKDVNEATATAVAQNFFSAEGTKKVTLVYTCTAQSPDATLLSSGKNLYYIFNLDHERGFVILSGEDALTPVLGWSNNRSYDAGNLPPAFIKWMEGYKEQIIFAKENHAEATPEIETKWDELLYPKTGGYDKSTTVAALVSTTWNQSPYYNALCPGGSVTGCVATAMAQIMKYWNYPQNGTGIHSYNHPSYGTLSANFGSTTYNWGGMPNNVSSSNSAVATLMYHCGVSVDMNYSPSVSGAWVIASDDADCSENSYKNYFGYDPTTVQGLRRDSYTDTNWKNLLKNELDNSRPLQYAGFGSGGGHTWVCDGYDNSDRFHMNWGWGGAGPDGYFTVDNLNPPSLGTGGGSGGFNSGQQAVIGIKPPGNGGGTVVTGDIQLYAGISINPNPINFGQSFTVSANVINAGTADFSGDYTAAIFTAAGNLVDFVEILSTNGTPLPPGYYYNGGITFSNAGILAVPGSYKVGIFFRPTGGEWVLAGASSFTNPINVTINGPNAPIKLYTDIAASPTSFVQGQAGSVNVNLYNSSPYTFYGQYTAALYDQAGNFVEQLSTLTESNGLFSGSYYTTPYLTFNSSAITAEPGSYILAILYNENGSADWYLCGSDLHTNPVNIIVVAPALTPDIYEANNSDPAAYNLTLSWSGNAANKKTTGSNIHLGTDIDFYKINLPSGYNYTITTRVHDSYNSGDGNTYTNDVLWSYKTPSGSWSSTYDDVMQGNITMNGGGLLKFQVAPYFPGQMGTYLLDVHVSRTAVTGIEDITPAASSFDIYPNPSNGNFTLATHFEKPVDASVSIYTTAGQSIREFSLKQVSNNLYTLSLENNAAGLYFISLKTEEGTITQKVMIE